MKHEEFPSGTSERSPLYRDVTWIAPDGRFRIIRCAHNLQWIPQRWKGGYFRPLSFHMQWESLHRRHKVEGVPSEPPNGALRA